MDQVSAEKLTLRKRLKARYERHERALVPGLLVLGFIVDVITFRNLQIETTFILLGAEAIIAGLAIMYINIYDGRSVPPTSPLFIYLRFAITPFVFQFTLGALLSASLVFYWFSGAFSASWPIMAFLVLLMASNEVFRHFYLRPFVQMAVYSFVLFSYFSLLFPYVFRSLAPSTFVLGGALSTLIVLLAIIFIGRFAPRVKEERKRMVFASLAIFGIMNTLYFLNVIPPIPLSIRDAGIYHDIVVTAGEYVLMGEEETYLDNIWPGQTIHKDPDGRVYAYTAIFAPTDLRTTIFHQWEFLDESTKKWIKRDRLSFSIKGGRDEGFRGYTFKSKLVPGKWRVTVETERGQVLGRIPFTFTDESL